MSGRNHCRTARRQVAGMKLKGDVTFIRCLGVRITCIGRKTLHRNHSNAGD